MQHNISPMKYCSSGSALSVIGELLEEFAVQVVAGQLGTASDILLVVVHLEGIGHALSAAHRQPLA